MRAVALLTSLSFVSWTGPVRAAPRAVALSFADGSGDGSCPDEAALRTRVERLVEGRAFDPAAERRARVALSAAGNTLRATVGVESDGRALGDRTIETVRGDCPALLASVALSLVLTIDPVRAVRLMGTPQPPVEATPAPPPPPIEPEPEPPPPRWTPPPRSPPRPPAPTPTRWVAEVGLVANGGITPGFGGGFTAGISARRPGWSLGLEARGQPPSTVAFGVGEVQAALAVGGVTGCAHVGAVSGCGLALFGVQPVAGRGFDTDTAGLAEVGFVGARLAVHADLGDAGLRVGVEALAPLGTTELRVDGRAAWTSPAVGGGLSLAVERRIR